MLPKVRPQCFVVKDDCPGGFCSYLWKEQCYMIHYLCALGMAFLCWYGSPELDWRFYFQSIICYSIYWFICFTHDRLILVLWSGSGHAVQFELDRETCKRVLLPNSAHSCCQIVHVEFFCVVNLFVCNLINLLPKCTVVTKSVKVFIIWSNKAWNLLIPFLSSFITACLSEAFPVREYLFKSQQCLFHTKVTYRRSKRKNYV